MNIYIIFTSLHFTIFDRYNILSQSVIISKSIVNEIIECNKSMQKGLSGGCGLILIRVIIASEFI